jgi:phosphotransferase system HPr-like phosphotransfer protein
METSLEQVVEERQFAGALQTASEAFFRLGNTLRARSEGPWSKKHYFQLYNEADALESFLDDYGARMNRTYHFFTELAACLRGFAQIGYAVTHLESRLASYRIHERMPADDFAELCASVEKVTTFLRTGVVDLFGAIFAEASQLGLEITPATFSEESFLPLQARRRLPRNMDVEELFDERRKIAEVVSKHLQACEMLGRIRIRRESEPAERSKILSEICTEEQARVYEATLHNLQSAYDTYIKGTVLESQDERLPLLRGCISGSLHLLQASTNLTHFYERHEDGIRAETVNQRIAALIDRTRVQEILANHLLWWADRILRMGEGLAHDLLPRYTNAQVLEVELDDDLVLHARPAALIVGIVNHFGTPVEMEVANQRCNAASILELLVTVGSHPEVRKFVFRGDEQPLHDIGLLFQFGLGEGGIDSLPETLSYLRSS